MAPATEHVERPTAGVPMVLAGIRLPVELVEQVDRLADSQGVRRSDVIRDALVAYVAEQAGQVGRDEAEQALEVLRRLVASRADADRAA